MAMATCPGSSVSPLSHCANSTIALPACAKDSLGHNSSFVVQHAGLVGFTRPVDAYVDPIIAFHSSTSFFSSAADDASSPLYWRSRRNSPLDVHQRSALPGRGSSLGAPSAGGFVALPARRPYSYSHLTTRHKGRRCPQGPQARDRFKNPACGLVDNASKDFDRRCRWNQEDSNKR